MNSMTALAVGWPEPDVEAVEVLDATDQAALAALFAQDAATTSGLVLGIKAGRLLTDAGAVVVAAQTITLSASQANVYVEISVAGALSSNTTGWSADKKPAFHCVSDTGSITTVDDRRVDFDFSVPVHALTAETVIADSDEVAIYDASAAGHRRMTRGNFLSGVTNVMTTLGDMIYGGASGVMTRLAGNTSATRKFLRQVGDGANSAAPAWDVVTSADVSDAASAATASVVVKRDSNGRAQFAAANAAGDALIHGQGAGGVLSGTYPNPGFAVDMATQAELDAHTSASAPHSGHAALAGAAFTGAITTTSTISGSGNSAAIDAGQNIIYNAGLNEWSSAASARDWNSANGTNWNTGSVVNRESSVIFEPPYAAKIGNGTNTTRGMAQARTMRVIPGRSYMFGAWLQGGDAGAIARIAIRAYDSTNTEIATGSALGAGWSYNTNVNGWSYTATPGTSWTQTSQAISLISTVHYLQVAIFYSSGAGAGAGYIYADCVQLTLGTLLLAFNHRRLPDSGAQKLHGNLALPLTSVTGAYTLTDSDRNLHASAAAGAFTVTLPAASAVVSGAEFVITKTDSSGNAVTVGRTGGDTINGAASDKSIATQWSGYVLVSDGSSGWVARSFSG
jgi:hypothetical protein